MTTAYILNICNLNEEMWEAARRLLPTERLKKAAIIQDANAQKQSLGAGLLLWYALKRRGIDSALVKYIDGKPILPDGGAHISLSHSGNRVACALSDYPVGIDVQDMAEGNPALLTKYYHPDEMEYIRQGGLDRFYQIWCRKESYIKAFNWRDLQEINTMTAPDAYNYFNFRPETTIMGCVLSKIRPEIWQVSQENLLQGA